MCLLSEGLHRSHMRWWLHHTRERHGNRGFGYFVLERGSWRIWVSWQRQYWQVLGSLDKRHWRQQLWNEPAVSHSSYSWISWTKIRQKRDTPVGKPILNRDLDGVPRKHTWLYHGGVGMLGYLANSVRPEIQMAVHQTARFSIKPMRSHELAIMRIGWY